MFLPPTIDLGNPKKYILSLRIKPTDFMFSLIEPKVGKNYCLRSTKFEEGGTLLENIQKIIFDLNFLTLQYAKTNVVFVTPNYTLVPSEFLDSHKKEELFNFVRVEKQAHVLTSESPKYGISSLYSVDEELYKFLARSLFNPQFYNHTTPLIELLEGRAKTTSLHSKLYVNIQDETIDLLCFSGNKLLLSQTYENLTPSEQAYYILKIWESLKLDQLKDQLLIAGTMDEGVLNTARSYIRNIERVAVPSEIFLWNKEALKTPLDLISLSL